MAGVRFWLITQGQPGMVIYFFFGRLAIVRSEFNLEIQFLINRMKQIWNTFLASHIEMNIDLVLCTFICLNRTLSNKRVYYCCQFATGCQFEGILFFEVNNNYAWV